MKYETVIQGLINYINSEILVGMNDWQAMLARIAISRMLAVKDGFKTTVTQNTFLQSIGVVTVDGMVDVDGLAKDLKEQIAANGKLEVDLPVFGKFVFSPDDVDTLIKYVKEAKV